MDDENQLVSNPIFLSAGFCHLQVTLLLAALKTPFF